MPKIDGRKDTRTEYDPEDLLFEYITTVPGTKSIGRCVIKGCGYVIKGGDIAARVVPEAAYKAAPDTGWGPDVKAVGWVCEEHYKQVTDAWAARQEREPPF